MVFNLKNEKNATYKYFSTIYQLSFNVISTIVNR